MNNLLSKIIKYILYSIIILLFSIELLILGAHTAIVLLVGLISSNIDIQVLLYLSLVIALPIFFVKLNCSKMQDRIKISLLILILLLFWSTFRLSFFVPTIDKIISIEQCIEFGGIWDEKNEKCLTGKTN